MPIAVAPAQPVPQLGSRQFGSVDRQPGELPQFLQRSVLAPDVTFQCSFRQWMGPAGKAVAPYQACLIRLQKDQLRLEARFAQRVKSCRYEIGRASCRERV